MKRILYNAIIPKWNKWTNDFLLSINQIIMHNKLWVVIKPTTPDCDAILRHFFRTGKKGNQTFKTDKTVIHFHVPNEIYGVMLHKIADDELEAEQRAEEWNDRIKDSPSGREYFMVSGSIKFRTQY